MQRILFVLAALPVMAVLSGCDGKGLGIGPIKVDADERPTDQTGDTGTGGTGGGGGTTPSENRFAGTWVASYGDDRVTDLAPLGRNQYAVRILLSQDGTTLSGSGTMFRMFEEGATAQDEVALRVSGTTSGDDATLAFRPSATGQFTNDHTWFVRLGSNRLTGMYTENDINNVLIRSGHAAWFRVAAADIDDAWVTRLSDAFAATGLTADDRTAALTLALSSEGALSGAGTFVVQVADNVASELNYNVTGGGLSSSRLTYTFGELDLISNEMDWFGFFNGNLLVVAYGQFNAADELIRLGHATWYRSPAAGPSAVTNTWVTSFSDTAVLPDTARTDHVATVSLRAETGGVVSGSGQILTEGSETAAYAAFTVENGTISGSRVQMDWRTPSSTFSWDLRLASSIMVGSYQQTDAAGRFIGRGTAEFRYRAVSRLVDTWVAAYVDTHAPRPPLVSQFALVTVSTQDTRGALGGTGSVRFANNDVAEQRRRLFNMAGTVSGDQIQWEWRGADLFGQTVWHLRQAGNLLFGTYTNFTNAGAVAATGEAVWVRATRTPALTP